MFIHQKKVSNFSLIFKFFFICFFSLQNAQKMFLCKNQNFPLSIFNPKRGQNQRLQNWSSFQVFLPKWRQFKGNFPKLFPFSHFYAFQFGTNNKHPTKNSNFFIDLFDSPSLNFLRFFLFRSFLPRFFFHLGISRQKWLNLQK